VIEVKKLRPQAMIFTLYGDYIRHVGGTIPISALVRLMSYFNVSAQAVRSTVSRMKRKGLLQVERKGAKSWYSLTARSKKIIEVGAIRIFQFPSHRNGWDRRWRLITYSVPEKEREARDRLRRELGWMGFGMLTNALWISPHDHRQEIEALADTLHLCSRIELFTAEHNGFSDPQAIVARCWDLPAINARYAAFIQKYKPMYEEHVRLLAQGKDIDLSRYFVHRFKLIHEFRRFPFIDPELPAELLPPNWHGTEAAQLFHQYHDLLAEKATAFFLQVYQQHR
jgi:phenylacetic acid degradation operon negative regulatory protein